MSIQPVERGEHKRNPHLVFLINSRILTEKKNVDHTFALKKSKRGQHFAWNVVACFPTARLVS